MSELISHCYVVNVTEGKFYMTDTVSLCKEKAKISKELYMNCF